ncbi:hypothetical protein [Hydrocarboniphaga effusa]|uniref:hypothetical protein n=1 Tax=Hydrocarboniphaga effusa TaxID=243629 RepID=UPI003BA8C475
MTARTCKCGTFNLEPFNLAFLDSSGFLHTVNRCPDRKWLADEVPSRQGVDHAITADWLRDVGFKWNQLDRQPDKHWTLWLGNVLKERMTSTDDLGIELAPLGHDLDGPNRWFCWLRSDTAHRYHRFVHLRHLHLQSELIYIIAAITGQEWNPENHFYGAIQRPETAERLRAEADRFDRVLLREMPKWNEIEKDDTRGHALPEHYQAFEAAKK